MNIVSCVMEIDVICACLLIPTTQGFASSPQQLSLIAFATPQRPLARNVTKATIAWAIPASLIPSTIVYKQKMLDLLSVRSAEMVIKQTIAEFAIELLNVEFQIVRIVS